MLRPLFPVLAALAVVMPLAAGAERLETTASRDHGAWRVATMENADTGLGFCAAETQSLFDQVLRVVLYETGDAFLEIRDLSWAHANGAPLRFLLIADGHERIVTGQGWDGAMSLDLIDDGLRAAVLDRLSRGGDTLDIRMPNRSRVAQFPLDGAAAAIASAQECWAVIRAGGDYQP